MQGRRVAAGPLRLRRPRAVRGDGRQRSSRGSAGSPTRARRSTASTSATSLLELLVLAGRAHRPRILRFPLFVLPVAGLGLVLRHRLHLERRQLDERRSRSSFGFLFFLLGLGLDGSDSGPTASGSTSSAGSLIVRRVPLLVAHERRPVGADHHRLALLHPGRRGHSALELRPCSACSAWCWQPGTTRPQMIPVLSVGSLGGDHLGRPRSPTSASGSSSRSFGTMLGRRDEDDSSGSALRHRAAPGRARPV